MDSNTQQRPTPTGEPTRGEPSRKAPPSWPVAARTAGATPGGRGHFSSSARLRAASWRIYKMRTTYGNLRGLTARSFFIYIYTWCPTTDKSGFEHSEDAMWRGLRCGRPPGSGEGRKTEACRTTDGQWRGCHARQPQAGIGAAAVPLPPPGPLAARLRGPGGAPPSERGPGGSREGRAAVASGKGPGRACDLRRGAVLRPRHAPRPPPPSPRAWRQCSDLQTLMEY